jgi:hypothetical protein
MMKVHAESVGKDRQAGGSSFSFPELRAYSRAFHYAEGCAGQGGVRCEIKKYLRAPNTA